MIIFATHHDESTAESIKLAKSIIEDEDIVLLKEKATKLHLLPLLNLHKQEKLMVFSHGKPNYCLGNDEIPAISIEDTAVLAHRNVFVYACWTASELGAKASAQPNCLYAGYNNTVITGGSEMPNDMQKIFLFIKNNFHSSQKGEDITTFLEQLRSLCVNAEQGYLALYPQNLSFIGVSKVLRDIWAKLEIWVARQKYAHDEAIEQPLW
jgi:hypothetical protein